jgi:hypothetical protein
MQLNAFKALPDLPQFKSSQFTAMVEKLDRVVARLTEAEQRASNG